MTVKRLSNIKIQYDDGNGVLASNYRLFFYAAGSSTKQNTYNSSAGAVANSNPVVLNALGEPAVEIWLTAGQSYKVGLAIPGTDDPPSSFVWTEDNITGVNDTTSLLDQWVAGPTPTFISGTSFSLVGDQTTIFHVGRRVKTTNTSGTIYSRISASVFGVVTTVTVVNDSGVLDSGLSAVSYGLLASVNPSTPVLTDANPIVSGSSDKTKLVRLEVDGLTTATTRVVTVPDRDLALRDAAVSATKQSASGTSIDFTGIPTWATKIIVQFVAISTNGTSNIIVQLGDSGGPETNGYSSVVTRGATYTASTAGLIVTQGTGATNVYHGQVVLCLADPALFTWTASATLADSATPEVNMSAGSKSTSAALDRVRITMVNGTDAFDAGIFNILYE